MIEGRNADGAAVRRVEIEYDAQGNAYKLTTYDAASAGNIVNQIQREFNGLGQMAKEYQEHSGAVNTSTSVKVQYAYSEMASAANHSRLTKITYPNGEELNFNYSSGLNDTISRLSSLSDSTGTLESYDYLGLGTVVKRGHSQPGVDLTYIKQSGESNGDAGDQYIGLDRFMRIADQRWRSSSSDKDRFQYGHDRNGNRLYRDNTLNNDFDELYHANGASNGYDGLNQLTDFRRGTLSDTNSDNIPDTVTTASRSQGWDFDALGNFDSQSTNGTGQSRSHNKQNEITSIASATTPTYDANGNMTGDENGKTLVFDAWNRLVAYKDGSTTLISYKYDAANRRVQQTASSVTTDFYFSDHWQVLEERISGAAKVQYIWSPVYVDAMILRDRDATADSALEERLWVMHDANFNVTGLLDNSGNVVERFGYDPYGTPTYFDLTWGTRSTSSYGWVYLHQGGRLEAMTGLFHFRLRDVSAFLGRWCNSDPMSYLSNEFNLVRAWLGNPGRWTDPYGLDSKSGEFQTGTTQYTDELLNGVFGYRVSTNQGASYANPGDVFDSEQLAAVGILDPKKDFLPGFLFGLYVKITATPANKDQVHCYYFWQEVRDSYEPKWQNDGPKKYVFQKSENGVLTMTDKAAFFAINTIFIRRNPAISNIQVNGKKVTVGMPPKDLLEQYLKAVIRGNGALERKYEASFRTHLVYVDPSSKQESIKGTWYWGYSVAFPRESEGVYKSEVVRQEIRWVKGTR